MCSEDRIPDEETDMDEMKDAVGDLCVGPAPSRALGSGYQASDWCSVGDGVVVDIL